MAAAKQAAAAIAEALAPEKVNAFVYAVGFVEPVGELVATPTPWSPPPAEVDDTVQACDDWAEVLVQAAAFAHVRVSPSCRGYTTWSSGRTVCRHGHCGWSMSARMSDVGTFGSARFANAALARVGQAAWLGVLGAVTQALFEAVLP